MIRHFVDLFDLTPQAARELLQLAIVIKREEQEGNRRLYLPGQMLGLLFEKPSLRTRVSFEAAMAQLGGSSIFLRGEEVGLGKRETIADFARVISQYVDVLTVRTFAQSNVEELARYATVPVINALSDSAHPCQAMADILTIHEALGELDGIRLVFVGDGNNVARSLALACALLGLEFVLTCPPDYDFPAEFRDQYTRTFPGVPLNVEHDPSKAVRDAHVVYTDIWTSMGQEAESAKRLEAFRAYQVNAAMFRLASPDAIFLHCLPAHREEEVTADVIDGPRSLIIPQAANRLHFQKALLVWLMQDKTNDGQGQPAQARARTTV
ncbi:ornithine carbamoyltransferase [Isosphaeraceae bacterium EP7]